MIFVSVAFPADRRIPITFTGGKLLTMVVLTDMVYFLLVLLTSPIWLWRMIRTGKIHTDWKARFGHTKQLKRKSGNQPRLLLHAVSVGEVNTLRTLVPLLKEDHDLVIASTTDTGFARARALFGEEFAVVRYPFDFSRMVKRFLDSVSPDAVGLVELELWPNFLRLCDRRGIPVAVINGRLSERSFRGYRRFRFLLGGFFRRLAAVAVQDEEYAARFREMGVAADRLRITGSMKWDNAVIEDQVPGAEKLARELGLSREVPIVVAGSTAPEETILIDRAVPDDVQLVIAPRKPEHFDRTARELGGPVRRSRPGEAADRSNRFLLDTIGELRAAYSLADIAIVGRSFGNLFGSDMTEPISVGAATIIGPAVGDFREMFKAFHEAGGIIQVSASELAETVSGLLQDEAKRKALAEKGRKVIREKQGASRKHADILRELVKEKAKSGRGTNSEMT
ncbi:MAG TPA: hypothetical protein ENJ06_03310 [Phycisphaeraceae bacterium]|nr:hypothetical protein [Phycisphaeraceae bacterium]